MSHFCFLLSIFCFCLSQILPGSQSRRCPETHRRGQPLQSGARNAKNAPDNTICGVLRKRSTTTGSVARLVPISSPRSAPRRVSRTNRRSDALHVRPPINVPGHNLTGAKVLRGKHDILLDRPRFTTSVLPSVMPVYMTLGCKSTVTARTFGPAAIPAARSAFRVFSGCKTVNDACPARCFRVEPVHA